MAKKGADKRLKRQLAPRFWQVNRKSARFILNTMPGPHTRKFSYPIGVVLRDILHVCSNIREVKRSLNNGLISVDGKMVRRPNFPIGLMDIVEIKPSNEFYRFVPSNGIPLFPIKINSDEKNLKLEKIKSKVTSEKNIYQYCLHDGRTFLSEESYNVNDTCLIELPKFGIKNHVQLKEGCNVIVTRGENAGNIGKVKEIKTGSFSLPKRVFLSMGEKTVELPVDIVMAIGVESSLIQVSK
ncbi:MAG TPA: 30S ribosomal protein S4e [Nitrososphaeraceae archaeon]|jgi:small subunit ribosomal protein S4e|nr:30S ribosomal protein S4e [Nitrososphaeraceae archaeon]